MDTKSFVCDECDPPCEFANKANYNRHRVSEHGYSVKFKCTICKISFSQHTKLQEHLKDKHNASSDAKNIKEMSEICLVKPSSATVTSTATSSAAVIPAAASTATEAATSTTIATISKESNAKQLNNMYCRCCLQNEINIDSNERLLNMKSDSLINQNQKICFFDAYSEIFERSIEYPNSDIREGSLCESCALFLESAYLFRQMCHDANQPITNVCFCCLLEKIDDNIRFFNMQTEAFVHKSQKVTFFEGYCEVNNCTVDKAANHLSQVIICEDCALQLESAYVFQRMCREAMVVLKRRSKSDAVVTNHSKINDSRSSIVKIRKKTDQPRRQLRAQSPMLSYNCKKCPKVFKSKIGLSSHRRIQHNDIHWNRILYVRVYKRRQAVPPLQNEQLEKQYTCQKCRKIYYSQRNLLKHTKRLLETGLCSIRKQRDRSKIVVAHSFACKHCEKVFNSGSSLSRHNTVVHLKLAYPCKKCNKTYRTKPALYIHERIEHQNILFACEQCAKKFKTSIGLSLHIKTIHQNVRLQFICKNCPKVCGSTKSLLEHNESVHLNKKYDCKDCDKVFIFKKSLSAHTKHIHLNISHHCANCTKVYQTKSALQRHNLVKHLKNKA